MSTEDMGETNTAHWDITPPEKQLNIRQHIEDSPLEKLDDRTLSGGRS